EQEDKRQQAQSDFPARPGFHGASIFETHESHLSLTAGWDGVVRAIKVGWSTPRLCTCPGKISFRDSIPSGCYAEGVALTSPGSRSAPWVQIGLRRFYAEGVAQGSMPCLNRSPKSTCISSSPRNTAGHSSTTATSATNATPISPEFPGHGVRPPS